MNTLRFSGAIPDKYEKYLGPLLFDPYAKDLVRRLSTLPENILELACGTGRVTRQVMARIASVKELCATDINIDMLLTAKKHLNHPLVDWLMADAQDLPFNDERFDTVICQFGIMFFDDKQKAFNEVHRVLRPGGLFVFNTWDSFDNNPGTYIIHKVLKNYFKEGGPDFLQTAPFSFYNVLAIKEMLRNAGFKRIRIQKIKKTAHVKNVDDFIIGFLRGTPLAYFLEHKKKMHNQNIFQLIKEELAATYGDGKLHIPMQAIVCTGIKQ